MTQPTKNPIPSGNILDQIFNGEKIDEVVNSDNEQYTDRLGIKRFTIAGLANMVKSFLTSISGVTGASNVGLKQGGLVQQAITYVTPEMFGAKADGTTDDTSAISQALAAAYSLGLPCVFGSAKYLGTSLTVNYPVNIEIRPGCFLNMVLIVAGKHYDYNNLVGTSLSWASCPAGTTSIAGNFANFAAGNLVAVKLNDSVGGSAGNGNETGSDFGTISTASSSTLTFTPGTRLAYQSPDVMEIKKGVKYTGTLAEGTYQITGDYTAYFSAGDVIRIENIDGTDGVEAKTYYFEFAKVMTITTSAVTFKARLNYTHTNPWLIKTGFVDGVKVNGGGRIKRLEIRQCSSVSVTDIKIDRSIVGFCYDVYLNGLEMLGVGEASTSNMSFCFGRTIASNIKAGGSVSTTDNAGFKIMSCPKIMVSNIGSDNTTASGSQGNYGVYMDALYTPYYCWNRGVVINNIVCEIPRSTVTRGVWFYGLDKSTVSNVSGAQTRIQGCRDSLFTNVITPSSLLEVADLVECEVKAICLNVLIQGCRGTTVAVRCKGLGTGTNLNIACRLGNGTTDPETGLAYTVGDANRVEVISSSASTSAITIQASNQSNLIIGGTSTDKSTVFKSVSFGSNVTLMRMEGNYLSGPVDVSTAWSAPSFKGPLKLNGGWQDGLLMMNGVYYWTDSSGVFRRSSTKPTSDSDGTAMLNKVSVPASATATGIANQIAFDSTYIYVCVATNTWVRSALATW